MGSECQSCLDWLWNPISAPVMYSMVIFTSALTLSYEGLAAKLVATAYILLAAASLALVLKGGESRRLGAALAFLSFFSSPAVYFVLIASGAIPNAYDLLAVVIVGYFGLGFVVGLSPMAFNKC